MEIHRQQDCSNPAGCGGGIECRRVIDCEEDEDELLQRSAATASLLAADRNGSGGGSSSSRSPSPSSPLHDEGMMIDGGVDLISAHQNQEQPVKQWSYEEQFRQLYNLSDESERKEFLDKLFDYMAKKGTPITRIPIMAKQPLDMYKLFKLVVERGGLVEVIKKKAWRDIAKELNLPASITSAAFTMRSQYVKYLYPYECEVECLSDPKELQLAIESNKRDRRHSDNVEFIQSARESERREQQLISQPTYAVTASPSGGLQLLSSPTVALPHTTIPPYSGGFIITPSGHHLVHTPRMSTAGPQLLQMAAAHPQLPIVVPSTLPGASPLAAAAMIPIKSDSTSPLMAAERKAQHDERHMAESPPVHPQIPVLVHTGLLPPGGGAQPPGGVIHLKNDERRHDVISLTRDRGSETDDEQLPPPKKMAVETRNEESISTSRMPFTNISIRPTPGTSNLEGSPSILVQIELNNVIYQGVLFARPLQKATLSPPR